MEMELLDRRLYISEASEDGVVSTRSPTADEKAYPVEFLQGAQFWLTVATIALIFFLATVETFIAVTALVAIANDLGGFETSSWVLSSYQLGYVAVIVIFAKLSDIFGRKLVYLISIVSFTIFSGGCAAAQTMNQLIILRGLQGVAGGGCWALSAIILVELVPPPKLPQMVARTGVAIVLAMVSGPIMGGVISDNTTWRWIFLLNVPLGTVGIVLAACGMPNNFPHHNSPKRSNKSLLFKRIDTPGCALLMVAAVCFTAAFQEAGATFGWGSAYFISLITVSSLAWCLLLLWERRVTNSKSVREPIMPWRFCTDRVMVGIMLGFLFVGVPMAVTSFQLPQRFQLVNNLSDLDAGVRLVPYGGAFPLGMMLSTSIANHFKLPGVYFIILGAILQTAGYALLSTLGDDIELPRETYAYEVICGLGCGITYQVLYVMVPFVVHVNDKAVGLGSANQFRYMGSAFGLAIVTSVFNEYTKPRFSDLGVPTLEEQLYVVDTHVPAVVQDQIRTILAGGYSRQMLVLCSFSVAQLFVAALLWRRKQIMLG
ncbi:Efflux pump FUS6 [Paramyrothecium foliicola]|nr:Efflux pump FUS6 [Paramyrothecium foliicola]